MKLIMRALVKIHFWMFPAKGAHVKPEEGGFEPWEDGYLNLDDTMVDFRPFDMARPYVPKFTGYSPVRGIHNVWAFG